MLLFTLLYALWTVGMEDELQLEHVASTCLPAVVESQADI